MLVRSSSVGVILGLFFGDLTLSQSPLVVLPGKEIAGSSRIG